MPSKKLVVLLVFAVVICGVLALTLTGGDAPTDPTTPDDNDTYGVAGEGYTSSDLPRGVNVDGIVPSSLVNSHEEMLSASTFELTVHSTEVANDGERRVTTVYRRGETGVHVQKSANGAVVREQYFDIQNETLYTCDRTQDAECPTGATIGSAPAVGTDVIRTLFESGRWSPEQVDESGAYVTVELGASRLSTSEGLAKALNIENTTTFLGSATVDSRQVITQVNTTVTGDVQGRNTTLTYSSTVEAINQTTVPRPEWVAIDNDTRTREYGMQTDNRTLFVMNPSDGELAEGTEVMVYVDEGDTYRPLSSALDEPLAADGTLYLTIRDGSLVVYNNEIPAKQGNELTAEAYLIEITRPDGEKVFDKVVRP